jgi:2-iminobutanoate/2-iminopropanoate deaminase
VQVIQEIFGNSDRDPLPLGTRVGDLIHASRIVGLDLETGQLGAGIEQQMTFAFHNLRHVVEQGGGSIDNIAQVSFFLKRREDVRAINPPWVELFPDESDRPTYKFMLANLPGDQLVQLETFALVGQRRQPLYLPKVAHSNPIPMGVRIGPMLFSSRVLPHDPATGQPVQGIERQAECLFQNVQALLTLGGFTGRDLLQGRLFVADRAYVPIGDGHWQALTAGSDRAPVLHTVHYDLVPSLLIMLEVIAAQ